VNSNPNPNREEMMSPSDGQKKVDLQVVRGGRYAERPARIFTASEIRLDADMAHIVGAVRGANGRHPTRGFRRVVHGEGYPWRILARWLVAATAPAPPQSNSAQLSAGSIGSLTSCSIAGTAPRDARCPLQPPVTRKRSMKKSKQIPSAPIADQARQGDVLIHPVANAKRGARRPTERGRVVLAHGEVTGHSHDVADSSAAVQYDEIEFAGTTVLDVTAPTITIHQEHAPVPLVARQYEVRRAEEWTDSDEPRQVTD
jgi:hypothetical protein